MDRRFKVRTSRDALEIASAMARRSKPGENLIAGFDRRQRLQIVVPVDTSTDTLLQYIELFCQIVLPKEALFVVSNRLGEVPADRPEDESDWEAMAAVCTSADVILLDWWIAWSHYSFSVAEFALVSAGWGRWGIDPISTRSA